MAKKPTPKVTPSFIGPVKDAREARRAAEAKRKLAKMSKDKPDKRTGLNRKVRAAREELLSQIDSDKQSNYDRIAGRVMTAVNELNHALAEACDLDEMRVEIVRSNTTLPAVFNYRIYRLSHATLTFEVMPKDSKSWEWRQVGALKANVTTKDPD